MQSPGKYFVIPFQHQYDPDVYLDFHRLKGRDESWFQTIVAFDRCDSERSSSGIRLSASGTFKSLVASVSCVCLHGFKSLGF